MEGPSSSCVAEDFGKENSPPFYTHLNPISEQQLLGNLIEKRN